MLANLKQCTILFKRVASSSQQLFHGQAVKQFSYNIKCVRSCRRFSVDVARTDIPIKDDIAKADIPTEDPDYEGETDPFMRSEIKKYNVGKRWLAQMMGEDIETFTQKDIDEAIEYLLPSHLWAKDARPIMKHPYEIFPKSKESKFDRHGRPTSSAFYTGKPKFHDLAFEIWSLLEILDNPVCTNNDNYDKEIFEKYTSSENEDTQTGPKVMQWVKKIKLEQILNEPMSEKNYDVIMHRLKKLSRHDRANEIQGFLRQFQVPVHTAGKEELKEVDVYEGFARAMGYRKTAIAEVIVREGSGTITVNTKPLLDYFFLPNDREQIMFPLLVTNGLDQFDIETHVIGGGTSGKSGAIRLGISRAIAALCPQHFDALDNAGLLIRDYRQKERKKPGRKKARRAFQWVKR